MDGRIQVGASGSLLHQWGITDTQALNNLFFGLAKRHLIDRAAAGELTGEERVELTTYNARGDRPGWLGEAPDFRSFDVDVEDPAAALVIESAIPPHDETSPFILGAKIIEMRDNINAIFSERLGGPLLKLPEERALRQLVCECADEKDFVYRLSALAGLIGAMDKPGLERATTTRATNDGSINALEAYLNEHFADKREQVVVTIGALRKANRIRQMFPIHSDSELVLESIRTLGLSYPIRDYKLAWRTVLRHYSQALDSLLNLITGHARTPRHS
jgi:hypothetical protein